MAQVWLCLGLAQLAWAMGDIVWSFYELPQGVLPSPSIADGFYFVGYPLLVLSIFLLPSTRLARGDWFKATLDMSIVLLTIVFVLWIYWIGPLVASLQQTALVGAAIALAYPIGDLILLYAVLSLLYKQRSSQYFGLYVLLILNYMFLITLDSIYGYQAVIESYASGGWLDFGWVVATLNFGLIGVWQATRRQPLNTQGETEALEVSLPARLNTWLTYLPYACAILTYLMLERTLETYQDVGTGIEFLGASWLTWSVGVIIGLVLLRQVITLRENNRFFAQVRHQAFALRQTNEALQVEIDERQQAEVARTRSETLFRLLFEHMPDAVMLIDPHNPSGAWPIVDCNTAAGQMNGYAPTALIGQPVDILNLTQASGVGQAAYLAKLRAAGHLKYETHHRRHDGLIFPIEVSAALITVNGRELILGIDRDITERKQVEAQLQGALDQVRQSEERYHILFDHNPQPMWVLDVETLAFLEVNEAAIRHYGYSREEFQRMNSRDLAPDATVPGFLDDLPPATDDYREGGIWRHQKKDGALIDVEITTHRLMLYGRLTQLVLVYDVTARRNLEEQLRQTQKMETIGQLAGGIAHDFNNLLTGITGYSELALQRVQATDPVRRDLEQIKKASARATALTRQLLAFSRKQILQPQLIDLNVAVAEMEAMLRRLIGEHIQLRTILASTLGSVQADPGQLEQVIMNLVINARDAMPNGGQLTLETASVYLDEAYARQHIAVNPGHHIMLAISDTGTGMDEQTQKHLFEPFFTTKEVGKGTGLGLATVYGIVKQSGGHMWFQSEIGVGTVFKVYLPRMEQAVPKETQTPERETIHQGTETILLAEDEETVRELACTVLSTYGYQVLAANNGSKALLVGEGYPAPIHLLLTDVIMPELNGSSLAKSLAPRHPAMKVLYMSGYTDNVIVRQAVLADEVNFIQKPFTPAQLADKVRAVLDC
ncbi:MAG: PAS domain S-box protein [Chloroflexi bacterium]|nr:PAS domain S-box protein [Chloroflexota bacterium]